MGKRFRVDRQRRCGKTGAQTRTTWAKDGHDGQVAVAVYLEDGTSKELVWTNPWEPKQPHSKAGGLCVTKRGSIKLNAASAL